MAALSSSSPAHKFQLLDHTGSASGAGGAAPATRRQVKVSVVGVGAVGMAAAISILNQQLCSVLALVDVIADKVRGEVLDLQHGMPAARTSCTVIGGTDFALTKDSNLCVITAGVRQRVGESRPELLNRNAQLVANIVRQVAKHSPNTVLLIVSNPVDVMTYLAWKVSGFPASRVLGSGTTLDSSRFRSMISEKMGLPVTAVHAYVVGEHGDSSVALFSSLNVFGTPIRHWYPGAGREIGNDGKVDSKLSGADPQRFSELPQKVVNAAGEIIKAKGYTSWGIGFCCASLARAILKSENVVAPVSTIVPKGTLGFSSDVALSLPCELDAHGVRAVLDLRLDPNEHAALLRSSEKIIEMQNMLDLPALLGPGAGGARSKL